MSKALGKSLAKSAAVLIASWIGFSIAPEVGCLVSLIGSFLLLLGSYHREWKLTRFSVLLPPVTGILCFLVQMTFFQDSAIAWMLFLPVAVGGWFIGWIRGKTHDVYKKKGRIYAQRTVLYLSVWLVCYCITQIFGLLRIKGLVVFGLLSGAFSTAMLMAVAVVLLQKARAVRAATVMLLILLLPLSVVIAVPQDDCSETSDDDCSAGSVSGGGGSGDNLSELAGGMVSAGLIFILGTGLNIITSVSSALGEGPVTEEDEPSEEEVAPAASSSDYDRLVRLIDEVRDPGIYAEVEKLLDQYNTTGRIDPGDLARVEALQEDYRRRLISKIEQSHAEDSLRARQQREIDLQQQGMVWNPDRQAWVPGDGWRPPGLATGLDDYYGRGDYINRHIHELTPEQRAAVERIMSRIGWQSSGVDQDDISHDDLDQLDRLSRSVNNILTGKSESEGATAQLDAAEAELNEQVARATAQVGRMAAARVEATFSPFTRGAVSGFIFGALEESGKGAGAMVKNGFIRAGGAWVDNRIGGARPGNIRWNALSGGLTAAAEEGLRGGSIDDMKQAGLIGGAFGGFAAGLSKPGVQDALDSFGKRIRGVVPGLRPTAGVPDVTVPTMKVRPGDADFALPRPAVGDPTVHPTGGAEPQIRPTALEPSAGPTAHSPRSPDEPSNVSPRGAPDEAAAFRSSDAEPAHSTRAPAEPSRAPPRGATKDGSPAGSEPPRRFGEPDARGVYDIDADNALHPWNRYRDSEWSPESSPMVPQVEQNDCAVASLATATGRPYDEVDGLMSTLRSPDGRLPHDRIPQAIERVTGSPPVAAKDVPSNRWLERFESGQRMYASIGEHASPRTPDLGSGHAVIVEGMSIDPTTGCTVYTVFEPSGGRFKLPATEFYAHFNWECGYFF